jgi:hypothetical protein
MRNSGTAGILGLHDPRACALERRHDHRSERLSIHQGPGERPRRVRARISYNSGCPVWPDRRRRSWRHPADHILITNAAVADVSSRQGICGNRCIGASRRHNPSAVVRLRHVSLPAHDPEVAGSNPPLQTTKALVRGPFPLKSRSGRGGGLVALGHDLVEVLALGLIAALPRFSLVHRIAAPSSY